jgi:hypothetical protein
MRRFCLAVGELLLGVRKLLGVRLLFLLALRIQILDRLLMGGFRDARGAGGDDDGKKSRSPHRSAVTRGSAGLLR